MIDPAHAGLGLILGLATGSFATTWALRFARNEQGLTGRSRCDACAVTVGFANLVPLVSFATLGGRCANCRAPIDPIHVVGEVAGGLLGVFVLSAPSALEGLLRAVLGFALLTLAVIDVKTLRLPDRLSAVVAVACAGLALMRGEVVAGLAAATITIGVLLMLRRAKRSGRLPGLGLGDVKLAGALALWLGAITSWMIVLAALAAAVTVSLTRKRTRLLPFGPWLAASAMILGSFRELTGWTGLG